MIADINSTMIPPDSGWDTSKDDKAVARVADLSPELAKLVLVMLCQQDRSVTLRKATIALDKFEKAAKPTSTSDISDISDTTATGAAGAAGTKRRAVADLMVCETCGEVYSEEEEENDASGDKMHCIYHTEGLAPNFDEDFLVDFEDEIYGAIDSEYTRLEFPEGFVYTCCDQRNGSPGCARKRRHKPMDSVKRAKVAVKEGDPETRPVANPFLKALSSSAPAPAAKPAATVTTIDDGGDDKENQNGGGSRTDKLATTAE